MSRPRRKLRASKRPSYDWHDHHTWIPRVLDLVNRIFERFRTNPRAVRQLGYRPDMKGHKAMYAPFRLAIAIVQQVLCAHLEIVTMRVGYYKDGKFVPYSVNQLLARMGIGKRRFQRALKCVCKYMGMMDLYPRAEQLASGKYVGYAWVRRITIGFFKKLGLYKQLVLDRVEAYRRLKGVPYREALAAEGVVILDPGSEPLHAHDVAQAFGMT
ncbi:MAG: hypothetical protein ACREXU_23385, partial [Gammaproteobacteria bacterium]